jgi:glycogen debranching enzyme
MNKIIVIILFTASLLFPQTGNNKINKFELHNNPAELSRIANPAQYFDKIGRKAAIMGFENGSFEAWVWPWKPLRNFDLQFFTGSSTTPISSKDIVKSISVTPEATTITYSYESFSVREIIIVPVEEPGVIILLDVNAIEPISIVPGFIPVMQPQWPAGVGGQYSYWNNDINAFVISASGQKNYFVLGSPAGEKMTAPPAHMFADNPLQFRIQINPETGSQSFIPIVLAGGIDTTFQAVSEFYTDLWKNAEKYYQKNYDYYNQLSNSTIKLKTPSEKFNLAFEWGKVSLHNLLVDNKRLGKGLVAGYGMSGSGGRPGFAWYFGGDAFINILPMNSYQDFEAVKDALRFVQKWQRKEAFPVKEKNKDEIGKVAHELSQSEGLIDWFNDYRYAYIHADTTPWYILAIGDYYRQTGDIQFIKESWKSIINAFEWSLRKDSNKDGLIDLNDSGLGVLEFGELVRSFNDLYTQAIFTKSLKELAEMAKAVGDNETSRKASELFPIANKKLEELFWVNDLGFYSFSADKQGNQVREKVIYSLMAVMLELMDDDRSRSTLEKFSGADMVTDWGVRNLNIASKYYHPSNYNYGAIWPYTSYPVATSLYNYNYNLNAYKLLDATINHIFDNGLGVSPEVFSGALNNKLAEAYHDQGFSISGYMMPTLRGLLGLKADAVNNKLYFSPKLPADWNDLEINNIQVGSNKVNLKVQRTKSEYILNVTVEGNQSVQVEFTPSVGLGNKIESAVMNGKELSFEEVGSKQAYAVRTSFNVNGNAEIKLSYSTAPELYLLPYKVQPGQSNEGMKVISQQLNGNALKVTVHGLPGKTYQLGVKNSEMIKSVENGETADGKIVIPFDKGGKDFIEKIITINF